MWEAGVSWTRRIRRRGDRPSERILEKWKKVRENHEQLAKGRMCAGPAKTWSVRE